MTDNDRKCVNELYKKIVMSHDPYYCDPETLPMPALCALIMDSVTDKNLALNTYPGVADDITEEAYDRRDGKR